MDGKDPRPQDGGGVVRDELRRLAREGEDVHPAVGEEGHAREGVQQARPIDWRRVDGQHPQLVLCEGDRPERVAGGNRRRARPHGELHLIERSSGSADGCRHRRVGDELEGELVVAGRLVRAADGHCLVAGGHAGGGGSDEVVRGAGVAGKLCGCACDLAGGERLRVGGVEARPLPRKQVLIDRLGEESVTERIAFVAGGHENVRLDS